MPLQNTFGATDYPVLTGGLIEHITINCLPHCFLLRLPLHHQSWPAVLIQVINEEPRNILKGRPGTSRALVQFTVLHTDALSAIANAAKLANFLDGLAQQNIGTTLPVFLQSTRRIDGPVDLPVVTDTIPELFGSRIDYNIDYSLITPV